MIRIAEVELGKAISLAEAAYPHEGCGIIFGPLPAAETSDREVTRVVAVDNARTDERARRYLITPESVREAAVRFKADGLEIIGFCHSHPDHPPEPSAFDREHAWPWYTYLIVPVADGRAGRPRAWRLRDDRTGFDEEDISVFEEGAT